MKHHEYNQNFKFFVEPVEFDKNTDRELLQYCVGATLYMPGTKEILHKIINNKLDGLTSMVMCFEDAIQESDLPSAECNVLYHLEELVKAINNGDTTIDRIPLIFVRVRNPLQFKEFTKRLSSTQAKILSGFVFPKFYSSNAKEYLEHLKDVNEKFQTVLYGMPIFEGKTLALKETRIGELITISNTLRPYKDLILNIRVGGTDFSSIFGVRRGINYSIHDIHTVRDCLSDILNVFTRDDNNYVVSGPVWEYFLAHKKEDLKELLEEDIHRSLMKRNTILNEAIDGLLREVILDKANGFVGKTIIHPSHLKFVNAMQTVTKEEYEDATQILGTKGGVIKSKKANKMNEINPHRNWAKKIVNRAKAYGVIESETEYLKLCLY